MFSIFKNPRSAIMFVASMTCVCAAAEELHRDQMTMAISSIASRELEADAPALLEQLSGSASLVRADYLINDRLSLTALVDGGKDDSFTAKVVAESPTLFLRYLGVGSLPIEMQIEMKKATANGPSQS